MVFIAPPVFGARHNVDRAAQQGSIKDVVYPVVLLFANLIIPSNSNLARRQGASFRELEIG